MTEINDFKMKFDVKGIDFLSKRMPQWHNHLLALWLDETLYQQRHHVYLS